MTSKFSTWRRDNKERWYETVKRSRAKLVDVGGILVRQGYLWHILATYKLAREDFAALVRKHDGGCHLCGKPLEFEKRAAHVDHCHATGRIRGLLCHGCNIKMSLVDKIGIERLTEYVQPST